uniref:FYVE, RhoGEF and PH domain containing 5a n=1 Tax=Myripristis murdjan TaxID=586833 RepID=A0A667YX98_9TELE
MSKPCPPVRGPKPPVAPKPRPLSELQPQTLSNGDLTHSDGETEDLHELAEEEQEKKEKREAQDKVNDNGTTDNGRDNWDDVTEKDIVEEMGEEGESLSYAAETESVGSEDTVKAAESIVDTTEDENTDDDLNQHQDDRNDTLTCTDHTDNDNKSTSSLVQNETGDEREKEEEDEYSVSEQTEKSGTLTETLDEHVEEQSLDQRHLLNQCVKENDSGLNADCLQCELLTGETEMEARVFTFGAHFSMLPTVNEEYPYDVIGPTDDASDTCESWENFMALDRKTIVTRSRSYSGKVPGYVPETVPEETGTEYQTHDYCTVALDQNGQPLSRSEEQVVNRLIPSLKPRRFLLYSRSAEGPELSLTSPTETGQSLIGEGRMKRKDDTLSLPCVITSSGSFSQRSHQSSSGVSTPTSLVDIPPPFELAYITKRPVTKSSPSLLIQHETSDKPKKKKTSFKRFLALKFKRKTDSKGFSDGSVRSSRSSSESSHHGPVRVIELDHRSTSSSPQLQSHVVKPQQRPPDLPSTFLLYKDHQKRKGDLKAYSGRGVSRVESFEERSCRPLVPLPLTKPRSISFPSADTSDYENIPAMSSDYENIQIPGRPSRALTVTEFFEDQNRMTIPCNENDGYVDMNSFPGIDSKPQSPKEETERYSNSSFTVVEAVSEEGEPVLEEHRLEEILGVLPQVYTLHSNILTELEEHISQWEESPRVVDVILSRREDFGVFDTYISEYDRSMSLLEESCRSNPAFANYLNNLSPDSKEYEDTQVLTWSLSIDCFFSTFLSVFAIFWQVFVKEGTLMKVSRKSRQPRHLFLMNDIMLYTYPQQDGKYRLKNTLSLSGMKVSKPVLDNVLNCLRIEMSDITITLSASSVGEREDWFHTLSRAIADHACVVFISYHHAREKLWMALGEAAPVLVPVSHVMMCMNCTSDFSLTLRRHHCNACGKVVCRACSRNRYPLKYLKDRVVKVCDHCYAELRKRGESVSEFSGSVSGACGNSSPRSHRASRPLSAVFQSLQPPSLWKSRKSTSPLNQDKVASESLPLQGFTVKLSERPEGEESSNVFQLYHKKTLYYTFRADDQHTARRLVMTLIRVYR